MTRPTLPNHRHQRRPPSVHRNHADLSQKETPMLAVLCLSAVLDTVYLTPDGPKFRPAPIPDRWLLKYAPKDMPRLPDRFFDSVWHYGFHPRSLRGAYTIWTKFGRPSPAAPPEATITHSGGGFNEEERGVT